MVNGRVAGGNLFEGDRLRTFDRRRRRDDATDRRERTLRRKNGINGANGDDDRERDAPANQPGTVDERFRRRRRGPIRRLERDAAQNRRVDGVKVGGIVWGGDALRVFAVLPSFFILRRLRFLRPTARVGGFAAELEPTDRRVVRVVPTFFENFGGVKGRDLAAQNRNEPDDEVKRRRRDPSDREEEPSARRQAVRQDPMVEQNADEKNAEREGRERAKRRR